MTTHDQILLINGDANLYVTIKIMPMVSYSSKHSGFLRLGQSYMDKAQEEIIPAVCSHSTMHLCR